MVMALGVTEGVRGRSLYMYNTPKDFLTGISLR